MQKNKSRDRQFTRAAIMLVGTIVIASCGQPPYANRAPIAEDSVPQDSPVAANADDSDPERVPAPMPTQAKPRPTRLLPTILGLPDIGTGTYLTPRATLNKILGKPTWNPAWDQFIVEALPPKMLSREVPRDVVEACPRFFQLSPREMTTFWAYFFQSVAVPESGLKLTKRFREWGIPGIDPVSGGPNISEGLLQLSYQDAKYHGCDFDWKADQSINDPNQLASIHEPKRNLQCGVRILNKQLFGALAPRTLFTHRPYYWSVLVRGSTGHGRVLEQLKGVPRFCKQAE